MIPQEKFIEFLKRKAKWMGSQKALAAKLGISAAYLSDVLNGRREPGEKMLVALGYKRVIGYDSSGMGGGVVDLFERGEK